MKVRIESYEEFDVEGLKLENVDNIYMGKDGCRCGCLGDYFYTSFSKEKYSYSITNNKEVERRLKKFKDLANSGHLVIKQDNILDIKYGERVITIYMIKKEAER